MAKLDTEVEGQVTQDEGQEVENQVEEQGDALQDAIEGAGEPAEKTGPKTVSDLQDDGEPIETLAPKDSKKGKKSISDSQDEPAEDSEEEETESEEESTPAEGKAAAFAPEMKIKVQDREYEINPALKDLIKDEGTYKVVKELHEKAIGLDLVKPKLQEARTQVQQYEQVFLEKVQPRFQQLEIAKKALENDDMDTVLEILGIPEQKIFAHVANKLRYQEMSPEQRAHVDRARNLQKEAYKGDETRGRLTETQEANLKLAADMRMMQLDMALSQGPTKDLAAEVDAKLGQGAFKRKVVLAGQQHALSTGVDLTPEQVIEAVANEYRAFMPQSPAPPASAPTLSQKDKVVKVASKKPPVIPSMSGRGASPTRKVVGSLAELKKLRREMMDTELED